jgi:hypothetical protein
VLVFSSALMTDRDGVSYDGPLEPDERSSVDWLRLGSEDDANLASARAWLMTQPACGR